MMNKAQPIGVIDSGVGGMTVLKWLQEKIPHEHFIFIGDTARTPYGDRSREEIIQFVSEMTDYLERRHIKELVVACNTITVLGTDVIRGSHDFGVIGMAKGSRMVEGVTKNNLVGFMATDFTVSTGAHKAEIERLDPEVKVFGQGCPKLVPLIENGEFHTPAVKAAVKEYVDLLKQHNVDTVLLSCTHYPFLQDEIQAAFGSGVTILDPAEMTTADAMEDLKEKDLLNPDGDGRADVCFTADLERAKGLAAHMLDMNRCDFHLIDLKK
jgi:glutamate racemase